MSNILSIKEQIKILEGKENNFLLTEVEPNYQHNFMEVTFEAADDNFKILDLINFGETYRTFLYEEIKNIEIDNIIVCIKLKDGTTYLLNEIRTDLAEILNDFNNDCCITKIKAIKEDGQTKYKTQFYSILEDFNFSEDDKNNTIEISNELSSYVFDYERILNIEEDYFGGNSDRDVRIYLNDDTYIKLESL